MAVVFDNAEMTDSLSTALLTWLHDPLSPPSKVAVGVMLRATQTIVSVTYGGVPMVLEVAVGGGLEPLAAIYGLAGPAAGNKTVAVTLSGLAEVVGFSVSVTGGSTTTCFSHHGSDAQTSAAASATTASAVGELVLSAAVGVGAVSVTFGGSETPIFTDNPVGSTQTSWSALKNGAALTSMLDDLGGLPTVWKMALVSFALNDAPPVTTTRGPYCPLRPGVSQTRVVPR